MMLDRSSVTRIGSATFSRIRLRRSRSRVASISASRPRCTCRSSSATARRRSVTSRSTETNAPCRDDSCSGCASTSNSRSLPSSGSTRFSSRAPPCARGPPITDRERYEVKSRLLISTARRRPSESSSPVESRCSARRFCTTMSVAASVMTIGSGSELMIVVSRSRCSSRRSADRRYRSMCCVRASTGPASSAAPASASALMWRLAPSSRIAAKGACPMRRRPSAAVSCGSCRQGVGTAERSALLRHDRRRSALLRLRKGENQTFVERQRDLASAPLAHERRERQRRVRERMRLVLHRETQ